MNAPTSLTVTAITHQGKIRSNNEDTILVGTWFRSQSMDTPTKHLFSINNPLLFIVADGMGGHAAGEVASCMTITSLVGSVNLIRNEMDLVKSLEKANAELYECMTAKSDFIGMGSTVAGILFQQERLIWFNVGDSRIYRYRDGFLRQLSIDDVPFGSGILRRSHGITQSLGGSSHYVKLTPHIDIEPLVSGWQYLICTDGLTDMLNLETMEEILGSNEDSDSIQKLFDAAMEAGGQDNISIILITISTNHNHLKDTSNDKQDTA